MRPAPFAVQRAAEKYFRLLRRAWPPLPDAFANQPIDLERNHRCLKASARPQFSINARPRKLTAVHFPAPPCSVGNASWPHQARSFGQAPRRSRRENSSSASSCAAAPWQPLFFSANSPARHQTLRLPCFGCQAQIPFHDPSGRVKDHTAVAHPFPAGVGDQFSMNGANNEPWPSKTASSQCRLPLH